MVRAPSLYLGGPWFESRSPYQRPPRPTPTPPHFVKIAHTPLMNRRRALVTGASSGIGECMALQLAERGWDLVLVARRADELARVAAAVSANGADAEVIVVDLATTSGVEQIEARIADEAGIPVL